MTVKNKQAILERLRKRKSEEWVEENQELIEAQMRLLGG